ncbi:MAG: MBL fold metallo-hydrolase [Myxococcales bacterium]|nr:MBL fold metallo-hydrolase [Myxococcales bacterium]
MHTVIARADQPESLPQHPWLRRLPLSSPTLPPAQHTNLYVIGHGELLLVDPGTPDEAENQRALAVLDELADEGHRVRGILLSHHHFDHTSGLSLLRRRLDVPVYAHAVTAQHLHPLGQSVDRLLDEGDVLPFAPQGLRVLHTPGHAAGHVCLLDRASRSLIIGDMAASIGTILIETTDGGDMRLYIQSLRRLQTLAHEDELRLWPAHGASVAPGAALLAAYIQHRAMREEKVMAALSRGTASLLDLVPLAYDDKPDVDRFLAARAILAHLYKLRDEGYAEEAAPGLWSPRRAY